MYYELEVLKECDFDSVVRKLKNNHINISENLSYDNYFVLVDEFNSSSRLGNIVGDANSEQIVLIINDILEQPLIAKYEVIQLKKDSLTSVNYPYFGTIDEENMLCDYLQEGKVMYLLNNTYYIGKKEYLIDRIKELKNNLEPSKANIRYANFIQVLLSQWNEYALIENLNEEDLSFLFSKLSKDFISADELPNFFLQEVQKAGNDKYIIWDDEKLLESAKNNDTDEVFISLSNDVFLSKTLLERIERSVLATKVESNKPKNNI